MKKLSFGSFALALGLAACANSMDTSAGQPSTTNASAFELAIHQVELGKATPEHLATLDSIAKDDTRSRDDRDQALMALSRAMEAKGDKEAAISLVEQVLASHEPGGRWTLASEASGRLRELLTGNKDGESVQQDEPPTIAPFAKALLDAAYKEYGCSAELRSVMIGGRDTGRKLGTFAVADALREAQRANPLCGNSSNVNESSSREASWTSIPTHAAKFASSLVVFSMDESRMIPSRYDHHLPMRTAEIRAHLEKNEGVIAVQPRKGAPPVVLMAAPRGAQLAALEDKLAVMTSLPEEPVLVAFEAKLMPSEIQSVVRSSYPRIRRCYAATLKDNPKNQGKAVLKFGIQGDGKVVDASVELENGLAGPGLVACLTDMANALVFPSLRGRALSTVVYPIAFSPGP